MNNFQLHNISAFRSTWVLVNSGRASSLVTSGTDLKLSVLSHYLSNPFSQNPASFK